MFLLKWIRLSLFSFILFFAQQVNATNNIPMPVYYIPLLPDSGYFSDVESAALRIVEREIEVLNEFYPTATYSGYTITPVNM